MGFESRAVVSVELRETKYLRSSQFQARLVEIQPGGVLFASVKDEPGALMFVPHWRIESVLVGDNSAFEEID